MLEFTNYTKDIHLHVMYVKILQDVSIKCDWGSRFGQLRLQSVGTY